MLIGGWLGRRSDATPADRARAARRADDDLAARACAPAGSLLNRLWPLLLATHRRGGAVVVLPADRRDRGRLRRHLVAGLAPPGRRRHGDRGARRRDVLRRRARRPSARSSSCATPGFRRDVPAPASIAASTADTSPTSAGAITSAGRKFPTRTSLIVEQLEADPDDQHAARADSAASASLPSARIESNSPAASEIAALDDEHAERRERDAGPERRGQRDRREAVEQGLRGERLVVAGQAVLDRADDGQRPDAEQQARGEERLADVAARRVRCARDPAPAGGRRAAAMRSSMPQRLADDPAEQHAAEDVERRSCRATASARSTPITSVTSPRPSRTRRRTARAAARRPATRSGCPSRIVADVDERAGHERGEDGRMPRVPRADVLLVSLGSTAGLRASDAELAASLRRAGASVARRRAPSSSAQVRTLALHRLALGARRARRRRARRSPSTTRARSSTRTTTAALLWPRPGAIRFDAPAAATRPGRHGVWQRPLERRRLREAPLLVPTSPGDARRDAGAARRRARRPDRRRARRASASRGRARDRRGDLRRRSRTRRAWTACSPPGRRRGATARRSSSPASTPRASPTRRPASRSPAGSSREAYRALLLRAQAVRHRAAARGPRHRPARGARRRLPARHDARARARTPRCRSRASSTRGSSTDDLAGAIRAALDEPAPRYVERSIPLLEPFTRAAVDRVVETELLPRLLG